MINFFIVLLLSVLCANCATVVPVDSSSVNVQQSGKDYSYTINENRGFAIEPIVHHQIPVLRMAPDNVIKHEHLPVKDQEIKPLVSGPQMSYIIPTYSYLPAIPYAYGVNYPYNLIATL